MFFVKNVTSKTTETGLKPAYLVADKTFVKKEPSEPQVSSRERLKLLLADLNDSAFKNIFKFVTAMVATACLTLSSLVYVAERGQEGSNIQTYWDAVWWSVVTALTVGYGDKYPVTPMGRAVGMVLMFAGVALMGIWTAKISSIFLERALLDRRGFVDERHLHDHLVVCGWKKEMYEFVSHVIEANPEFSPEKIVLVNNISDEEIETLLSNDKLKKIKVVKGDFFTKPVLSRAAPHRARKVIVLADATPSADGTVPTMTEADARTIMTAMLLSNIAKGVPVVAEILDSSMDQYLKLAHVNEIVYTREYSRLILAKASYGTGIPNIFQNLLSHDSSVMMTTKLIPDSFHSKPYGEFKAKFEEQNPGSVLVGILENSGNSHSIKEQALKRAQKTPDIKQLVENLQTVKSLKFNNPVFAPTMNYQVNEGSLAIVIETRKVEERKHGLAA